MVWLAHGRHIPEASDETAATEPEWVPSWPPFPAPTSGTRGYEGTRGEAAGQVNAEASAQHSGRAGVLGLVDHTHSPGPELRHDPIMGWSLTSSIRWGSEARHSYIDDLYITGRTSPRAHPMRETKSAIKIRMEPIEGNSSCACWDRGGSWSPRIRDAGHSPACGSDSRRRDARTPN